MWIRVTDGVQDAILQVANAAEAEDEAEAYCAPDNPDEERTALFRAVWEDLGDGEEPEESGEEHEAWFAYHPDEPDCDEDEHDWELGTEFASSDGYPGIRRTDICRTCGLERTFDQESDERTGRGGGETIAYERP